MNPATELAIRQRLEDKALDDPSVLIPYVDEDDIGLIVRAAFVMIDWSHEAKAHIDAHDGIEEIKRNAIEDYIAANFQSELAEWIAEMDEAKRDAEREERMSA